MTLDDLRQPGLPAVLPFTEVCQLLGKGRTSGYASARAGTFPVPVFKQGRWTCPTAAVLRVLEVDIARNDEARGTTPGHSQGTPGANQEGPHGTA